MINWFEKHQKISWGITLIIALLIFYFSSLSFDTFLGEPIFPWKSIVYHFFAFFFLGGFLLISLTQGKKLNFIFIAIILGLFYGVLDEFHQYFVPGRVCSFSDFLVNSAGIYLASLIYLFRLEKSS